MQQCSVFWRVNEWGCGGCWWLPAYRDTQCVCDTNQDRNKQKLDPSPRLRLIFFPSGWIVLAIFVYTLWHLGRFGSGEDSAFSLALARLG